MHHIDLTPFVDRPLTDVDWQHLMMRILFTPRGDSPSYADSLIRKAEKKPGLNAELPDPLLTLLGFTAERLPQMTPAFNSEMGNLFETIVKIFFMLGNPKLFSQDFGAAIEKLSPSELRTFKKFTSDCLFGSSAIELKYRYGSGEGLTKQKDTAIPLRAMGYQPVMLCLRQSPNALDISEKTEWTVYEGQDTIDYIHERTGFDLSRILQVAALCPLIRKRINGLQSSYDENIRAKLRADFEWALEGHRKPVHRLIAEDSNVRSEFLDDIGFEDEVLKGFLDHIIRDPGIFNDPKIKNLVSEVTKNQQQQTFEKTEAVC